MSKWITLIKEKLEAWWLYSAQMLPNFIVAVLVLMLFFFAARTLRNISNRFMLRFTRSASLTGLLSGILYTFVIISGFMAALDILELDKIVASLLAGVGIVGLALGFAFQDLTSNFISGAFIAIKRPFDVGHTIETNGFLGTVEEIQLRSTTLRTSAGLHVIIPNKDIFQRPIINYSRTDQRRIEVEFVIPNAVEVTFAEKIIRGAIDKLPRKNVIPDTVQFYYTAIENPNIRINVFFWTNNTAPLEYLNTRHLAIVAIYQAFTGNGIYEAKIPGRTPAG